MFTDYLAGALLLVGGWSAYRTNPWGALFPVVAWAWVTGMMSGSFLDQLEGTIRSIITEPHNSLVVVIKFLLLATCVVCLVLSFRRTSNTRSA